MRNSLSAIMVLFIIVSMQIAAHQKDKVSERWQ